MLVFVVYDISDNNTRSHFIKKLQYFGLRRVQKSVFSGFLELEERLDLASAFDEFLSCEGQHHADSNLRIMCKFYFNRRRIKDAS